MANWNAFFRTRSSRSTTSFTLAFASLVIRISCKFHCVFELSYHLHEAQVVVQGLFGILCIFAFGFNASLVPLAFLFLCMRPYVLDQLGDALER